MPCPSVDIKHISLVNTITLVLQIALQMLFQLWVGQSSEFFRRLALLLSPGSQELDSRSTPLTYNSVPLITDSLHRTLACCLGDLQRSYDFHRYFETQHQTVGSGKNARDRQKCRELNSLHTSVRSLQLHLKTLLNEYVPLHYCFRNRFADIWNKNAFNIVQSSQLITINGFRNNQWIY